TPPSFETTVVPSSPTASTRLALANATPRRGELEGVIGVVVAPASVVRSSLSPAATVSRQVLGSLQRIEVRLFPAPAGRDLHVFPPSLVRSRVPGPVA